jgi:hypothetical protein
MPGFVTRRNIFRATLVLALLLALGWCLMPVDHLAEAIKVQDRILTAENLSEEQLTAIYDRFGSHMDQLTDAQREEVWRVRREREGQKAARKLDAFFQLSPAERNAWLDREIAKRAVNDAHQRKEQQAASQLPPTATFPGSIEGNETPDQLDKASRQTLDSMSAEDRAKITEYERLYYERLAQKK